MNEMRRKWIIALRSDEYEQGRIRLRNLDNTYCCLGVACDVSGAGSWKEIYTDYHVFVTHDNQRLVTELNTEILDLMGLTDREQNHLMHMNDELKASFSEIADYLEELDET